MLRLLLAIKHKCPRLWMCVEESNGILFQLRYQRLPDMASKVLSQQQVRGFTFSLAQEDDLPYISQMLLNAPEEHLRCFSPHPFDLLSLRRLFANPSFLMMKVTESDQSRIAGYFFLGCFFIGRAFHGLYVRPECAGGGIGAQMWRLSSLICQEARLIMCATIAADNIPSLSSLQKHCLISSGKPIANGFLALRITPKQ